MYIKNEARRQNQPVIGDLVLLRSFAVDKYKGKKLSPRWEGPYSVYRIGKSGVSVTLKDIQTELYGIKSYARGDSRFHYVYPEPKSTG